MHRDFQKLKYSPTPASKKNSDEDFLTAEQIKLKAQYHFDEIKNINVYINIENSYCHTNEILDLTIKKNINYGIFQYQEPKLKSVASPSIVTWPSPAKGTKGESVNATNNASKQIVNRNWRPM